MSEIKVKKVTFGDLSEQQTAADRSFRNKIINGDMAIDQERGGAAVTPTLIGSTYVMDQIRAGISQASKLTFQQVVDAPEGFKYSQKITVASQHMPSAADYFILLLPIEGVDISDLDFGKSTGKNINVSFWVKGSNFGYYTLAIRNGANNRSYVAVYTVTNVWAKQSISIPADIIGTWATDTGVGLTLTFDLGNGTNSNTTENSWQSGNYVRVAGGQVFVNQPAGSTLNITGVQLEKAGAPSEFEFVPYAEQLRRCQRYFEKLDASVWSTSSNGTGGLSVIIPYKTTKRVAPAVTISFNGGQTFSSSISPDVVNLWNVSSAASISSGSINARL